MYSKRFAERRMVAGKRSRHWAGTLNNWTEAELGQAKAAMTENAVWGFIAKEIGKKKGTPHLHMGVVFANPRTMNGVKRLLGSNRWAEMAPIYSSAVEYKQYMSKDGDTWECGKCPEGQGGRHDIGWVREKIKEGFPQYKIFKQCTNMQQVSYLEKWNKFKPLKWREPPTVIWSHGPAGHGKTWAAWGDKSKATVNNTWINMGDFQWFTGYDQQERVIFDDFEPDQIKFKFLLRLLDRYPMRVRVHHGVAIWDPKEIIITTLYNPDRTYNTLTPAERHQLNRRITRVVDFEQIDIRQMDVDPLADICADRYQE